MMKRVEIGEVTFHIRPFDAFTQLGLFGDLQREILPALGGVMNVVMAGDKDAERDEKAMLAAFNDLAGRFDGATLKKWATRLLDEQHVSFETAESDVQKLTKHNVNDALPDFGAVLELMFHVGKLNFADPLARWASLSGLAQKLTAKLSASSVPTSSRN